MPLISIQEMIPGVRIALWKPEETPEELLSILGNTHLYESGGRSGYLPSY